MKRGKRTVVFEVGGVIDLAGGQLRIGQPQVSVAGQTAPEPGITLVRGELLVSTTDVVLQHLTVRPGEYGRPKRSGNDHDGLSTGAGAARLIVDHCTFSWATDENLSVGGPRFQGTTPDDWRRATSHAITYSHNLIYEGLGHSVHEKGEHSKGTLVHDNATQVLLLGNVYASNRERNALFKGGVQAAMVNNLIYNPGARAVHYNLVAHEWGDRPHPTGRLTLVGNAYRAGPDTALGLPLFTLGGAGDVSLYLADNLAQDRQGQPLPHTGRYTSSAAQIVPAREPELPAGLRWLPAQELERVLPARGRRPPLGARPAGLQAAVRRGRRPRPNDRQRGRQQRRLDCPSARPRAAPLSKPTGTWPPWPPRPAGPACSPANPKRVRGNQPCPPRRPKPPRSSLQMLAVARATAVLCA